MRQIWADGAAGWVENERIFDAVFAPVTAAILDHADVRPGRRLLDVGCGSGTLLAAGAAAGANVVGIDISEGMAAAAQRRVPDATIVVGDAQVADLLGEAPGAPFDRVLSRFGVMFFDEPAAAFANIRRSTGPGARMTFACWRGREENPMFTLGTSLLVERLDPPPEPPAPGAPGPHAFADPDRLRALLAGAGWTDITVNAFDFECDYGIDGSDGVEERLATILGTTTGRLARAQVEPRLGPDGWAAALDEVRAELRRHRVRGTVRFPGATWLVTAE
ncbi:class I SAM-dependent methyltransferase [Phytoactinopolyspora halotolerans]|uniref:Class I SAM-dependent methyltransferase n=2 Tax=Phytoactinopolyspora halotolerans TaxID=1981512 RepID=A0A6L9SBI0_9ACTN|nr:class I SAM-dependent methyltransferase [Phytoactinopolyspora halotolerans]